MTEVTTIKVETPKVDIDGIKETIENIVEEKTEDLENDIEAVKDVIETQDESEKTWLQNLSNQIATLQNLVMQLPLTIMEQVKMSQEQTQPPETETETETETLMEELTQQPLLETELAETKMATSDTIKTEAPEKSEEENPVAEETPPVVEQINQAVRRIVKI